MVSQVVKNTVVGVIMIHCPPTRSMISTDDQVNHGVEKGSNVIYLAIDFH